LARSNRIMQLIRDLLDVMLDNGKQGATKDLEPELPMVIHY